LASEELEQMNLMKEPRQESLALCGREEPTERLVYSFFCVRKGEYFFLDLEADEENARFN
jgi:hypothetical protein